MTAAWDLPAERPAEATSESPLDAFLSTRTLPPWKPVFGAIVTGRHVWRAGRKSRKPSRWATIRSVAMSASSMGKPPPQPAGSARMRAAPTLTHTRRDVGAGLRSPAGVRRRPSIYCHDAPGGAYYEVHAP